MSSVIPLGIFEKVPLRSAWPTEDGNFTPWLAEPANIAILGKALKMELEVEAVERPVGSFRADILARAVDEAEHRVIIENQFGPTDHNHLGQILTYLAGVEETKTIIWMAESIRSDHRAAVDWLNTNTLEDFSFFAIEIELWRIGSSPAAPRFNIVSSPNDWAREARTAVRRVGEGEMAESQRLRLAYWVSFSEYLKEKKSSFQIRTPNKDHWRSFAIGRAGFGINAVISTEKQRIWVEFYIGDDPAKIAFHTLLAQKDEIETQMGEPLVWRELQGRKASKICIFNEGVDPTQAAQYPELHRWMLEKMDRFRAVFAPRVRGLSLSPASEAPDEP